MSNLKFDDLPKEIQDNMLDHQEAQGNKRDPEVFRKWIGSYFGGFDWYKTPEGHKFWRDILLDGKLQTFYDRYPSPDTMEKATPDPLWDQVAVQAMAAVISTDTWDLSDQEARRRLAVVCYNMADDFMEEREKRLTDKTKKQ